MKKLVVLIFFILSLSYLGGCATAVREPSLRTDSVVLTDISKGLPREGIWRQNLALIDMNGDGFLDIVSPPARKPKEGESEPSIFLRDAKAGEWMKGPYHFPETKSYNYGGVAAGDINRDGYPDIVLAAHAGKITILLNDKSGGFIESPFSLKEEFHSRAVVLSDINGDGWSDIIALSDGPFPQDYKPAGLLVAISGEAKDWDVKMFGTGIDLFGDSLAAGDIRGSGSKDIAITAMTNKKEAQKLVWFGDGKGNFRNFEGDFIGDFLPFVVRVGDVKGDGKEEVVYDLSAFGRGAKSKISVFEWTGEGFGEISAGLESGESSIVFDLVDIDGDGKKELVILREGGLSLYRYVGSRWNEIGLYPIPSTETKGAADLRAGTNRDGSVTVVYNLGAEEPTLGKGMRAYVIKNPKNAHE